MPQVICPVCGEALSEGKPFCPSCGAQAPGNGVITTLKTYVDQKLAAELSLRIKDQKGIVREVADDAETIVFNRYRNYGFLIIFFVMLIGGLLAFIGISKFEDVYSKIAPAVAEVQRKMGDLQAEIANANSRMSTLKGTLDKLSSDAENEAQLVNRKSSDIANEFTQLDSVSQRTERLAKISENRMNAISGRLDEQAKRLDQRVSQIATQMDSVSVQEAYPTLGQQDVLSYMGRPWKGKTTKKQGEIWVSISVAYLAGQDYSRSQIESLEKIARDNHAVPYLGPFAMLGPVIITDELGRPASAAYYFDLAMKPLAEKLAESASVILATPVPAELLHPSDRQLSVYAQQIEKAMAEDSGIDIQIIIMPKKK